MSSERKPRAKAGERTEQRVRLRVICLRPPEPKRYGAEFGLQDNSTTAEWVIHRGETHPNGDIHFEFECRIKPHQSTGAPNFLGSFVHGDSAQRFVYLSWRPTGWNPRQPASLCPVWVRRMKVHLSRITWKQIDEAVEINGVLEAVVEGTGRDGGPSCASVPLLGGGWTVRKT